MKQYSIMIIDDDEVARYTIKRLLKSGGITAQIEEAQDGEEAIQFFKNNEINRTELMEGYPPVIVFLDINMPRMNGFEFLNEFQTLKDNNDGYDAVVFMMVTSSNNAQDKELASQYDFVKGYINKMPKKAEELHAHISDYLPK